MKYNHIPLEELTQLQQEWAKQVRVTQGATSYFPKAHDIVFTLDVQYVLDDAYVAVDIQTWNGRKLGTFPFLGQAGMRYKSGFFTFREGEPLLEAIQVIREQEQLHPDLIIVDGHGIAHPRKFGVACWLGIQLGIPTIGVAKNPLLHYEGELGQKRASTLPILLAGEEVGKVIRTQKGIKPIYASVGHLLNLEDVVAMVLHLAPKYRLLEPIRRADQKARHFAKQ